MLGPAARFSYKRHYVNYSLSAVGTGTWIAAAHWMTTHERAARAPAAGRKHTSRSLEVNYEALAVDYDGTLAENGTVPPRTLTAIKRVKRDGRKLVLVTSRELEDLMRVFPEVGVFDLVVAENGALLYTPRPYPPKERPFGAAPPSEFVTALEKRGVAPLSCGRIIVTTRETHVATALETIRAMGLRLEVIFNKGALMMLPFGVNKASGLLAALEDLGIDPAKVVGVGDAENDHALLSACGLGIAVANAVPALTERADLVMSHPSSEGVIELIDELLTTDFGGAETQGRPHPTKRRSSFKGHTIH